MASLGERLNAAAPAQAAGQCEVGPDGGEFTGITTTEPITDWSDVFRRFNLDPESFEIAGDTVRMSVWQSSKRTEDGDRDIINLYSYRAQFTRRRDNLDLPALYAAARRTPRKRLAPVDSDRVTVVVFSDPQIGKTDHRGGTPELLERLAQKRDALDAHLRKNRPSRIVFVDAGDGPESFENVASQAFTNDLSFPQQLDVYATELWEFQSLLARFAPVDVLAVPSNHGAWRNSKQNLGRPQDDWGLHVHKQVNRQAQVAGLPVTLHVPEDWLESLVFDVNGTRLGVTHGHQYGSPDRFPDWWAKQTHGGQPFAHADVAITGHYHHLRVQPTGRNPQTGRSKWWVQSPPLDAGSSWYMNRAGDDSDPGMVVFEIDSNGFNVGTLTVL